MPGTPSSPPFDMASRIPELAPLARESVLLYPRAGAPGVRDSSLGGPLLWPAGEPWPMCAESGHWKPLRTPTEAVGPEPVAMVPVVQLYARDVPELPFPAGTDVLQIVWCTLVHDGHGATVLPKVYWRHEETVARGAVLPRPPEPREADEEFLPRPCTVSPTRVVEYPNADLPPDLGQRLGGRFEEIEAETGLSYHELATTVQSKAGGYPGWVQEPRWPRCGCGRRMEHLLSVTATEPVDGPWFPSDGQPPGTPGAPGRDRRAAPDRPSADGIGHGMDMGDLGGVYLFVCLHCPDRPYAHRYDC
ncbi:hypothetical protein AB0O01_01845 [Streptomyces sp. NPDC093252]|uniref:hypothetical protein n=1 Tax=Streptomyces sp. NPDC093252 TaxID=3154980 RepID=UPI00343E3945